MDRAINRKGFPVLLHRQFVFYVKISTKSEVIFCVYCCYLFLNMYSDFKTSFVVIAVNFPVRHGMSL